MPAPPVVELIGRDDELGQLAAMVDDLLGGRGGVLLVEGEPGAGKSALLAAGLRVDRPGVQLRWAVADELGRRAPLRVMLDCFGVGVRATDPRLVEIAALLRGEGGPDAPRLGTPDNLAAAVERLLALVDQLCADAPLILVIDDLQWADELSLTVCQRLVQAVERLPLLLAGAYRSVPCREELTALRASVRGRSGRILRPGPLDQGQVEAVVGQLVGAPPGPVLRELAAQAGGNPRYLEELVAALRREEAILLDDGIAELRGRHEPVSLAAAIASRLTFLSAETTRVLRVASLLGLEFSVLDLAAVVGATPTAIAPAIEQARAAGVVVESGPRLAFRHPLLRQALYAETPRPVRSAQHRHAAEVLASAGASTEDVAAHLLNARKVDRWSLDWLVAALPALTVRSPELTVTLLRQVVEYLHPDDLRWETLAAALAKASFRLGVNDEARSRAGEVLAYTRAPQVAVEMRWILICVALRTGQSEEMIAALQGAIAHRGLPDGWRARLMAMSATLIVRGSADVARAEAIAREALDLGRSAADRLAVAFTSHSLVVANLVRRNVAGALDHAAIALAALGADDTGAESADLRVLLLANRVYGLCLLERLPEAREAVRSARTVADQSGAGRSTTVHLVAAMVAYQAGRWDEACAELDAAVDLSGRAYLRLVRHGLGALLAIRRNNRTAARGHLAALPDDPLTAAADDRFFSDYLLVARALAAARDGDAPAAVAHLAPILDPDYDIVVRRFEWLPTLVRLALEAGDPAAAAAAAAAAGVEADRYGTAAAEVAARRCAALFSGDPEPLRTVAEHYRHVGRLTDLAEVLEDRAVALGAAGRAGEAHPVLTEAIGLYTAMGADWDLRRAAARARGVGVRLGSRGPRRRPTRGWHALTPTERRIVDLIAEGRSNPAIAAELLLSRRTVQSHVSHVLTKLEARSRVEIAREVTRRSGGDD